MLYQIIFLILALLSLIVKATEHDKIPKKKVNIWIYLIDWVFTLWLLYKGGFFDVILNKF